MKIVRKKVTEDPQSKATYDGSENKFVKNIRSNVKSDLIEITHDKLENILLKHLGKLGLRKSWIGPLSLFITLLVSWLSSDFKIFLGLPKEFWQALFALGLILSGIWLVCIIFKILYYWSESKIEYLMRVIKNADIEKDKK